MSRRKEDQSYVMISVVAKRYDIHPQTLRLYEREGLLKPARSAGNTRLYDKESIRRLRSILTLTRDMGVNLAGVEVILGLQEQLDSLQAEMDRLMRYVQEEVRDKQAGVDRRHALIRFESGPLTRG